MTQHTPTAVGLDDVFDIEHRLAEKPITSLIFDRKQPTLNHTDTRRRDIAVFGLKTDRIITDLLQHGAPVLGIEQ